LLDATATFDLIEGRLEFRAQMCRAAAGALESLGWDDRVAALFAAITDPRLVPARVVRVERSACVIATSSGEHVARASALPAVGDWVLASHGGNNVGRDDVAIVTIAQPWSTLSRRDPEGRLQVLAANVDIVLVTAPADRLNPARVERETVMAWDSGARPVVIVTKSDLAEAGQVEDLRSRLVGVDVVATSAVSGVGLDEIRALLQPCRTAVLLGPSGAGKSSFVNALLAEERMAAGEVRAGDHRGRHTTTSRQLLVVPGGGVVIDTPGLRSLAMAGDGAGVAAAFADIEDVARRCRFGDCGHVTEPGCAVVAALANGDIDPDRLRSYRKVQREITYEARRDDPVARQQAARVWKARSKAYRSLPKKR
jgi:ribosome biogenesis GTPase / thiamine phosphate phosphatase